MMLLNWLPTLFKTITDSLVLYFSLVDAQGSFLTSYVKRLSNFGFLNGQNGRGPGNGRGNQIVNNLIAMLRNRIDFNPDDDDDIEMPTQGSQNVNNGRGGFSVRGLLGNLVSTIANAAAEEFAGPGNGAGRQCIRRIIEVSSI